jgi:hypothetical protein
MPALYSITLSGTSSNQVAQERNRTEAMIEQTLVLLADIERRYEHERSIIEGVLHPQPWKDWRLEQLAYRHACERQLLVQQLCALHYCRTIAAIGSCLSGGEAMLAAAPMIALSGPMFAAHPENKGAHYPVRQTSMSVEEMPERSWESSKRAGTDV